MLHARADGHKSGVRQRHVTAVFEVLPPGNDRSVGPQRETVQVSGRDGDEAGVRFRRITLAIAVESPADDGAVRLDSQAVIRTGGHGDEVRIRRRRRAGTAAQADDRAIGLEGEERPCAATLERWHTDAESTMVRDPQPMTGPEARAARPASANRTNRNRATSPERFMASSSVWQCCTFQRPSCLMQSPTIIPEAAQA